MTPDITEVLDLYHARREAERAAPAGELALDDRLLAVGPETGRLINILAKSIEAPVILEIGTSYGYSGIWLAEAARAAGGRLITMEISAEKSTYAREMSAKAGLAEYVDFRVGDAVEMIGAMEERIDFVLLDLWKDLYTPCLEAFVPKLNPGAILVADNVRPERELMAQYIDAVRAVPGMASVTLPVGSGLEVSRYR
ncbi:O-methyltransferase [Vannielia sp. SX4]|uniref:O-methyltransferase n=1 Tax=Vannielia sp. SX4 TaxID=3463852 RepID=UPI004058BC39